MDQPERIEKAIRGEIPLTDREPLMNLSLIDPSRELAIPIICDIEFDRNRVELAANVVNEGFAVSNLPDDAIVETPVMVNANGITPVKVGALPEPIKGLCEIQISIQKILVEAYEKKSKKALLQALIIDPIVDDLERAKKMMEAMIKAEKEYLPELK